MNASLSVKMFAAALLAFGSFGVIGEVVAQTVAPLYKKVWWDPNQNGMGTFCDQQTSVTTGGISSEVIFCSWFHYMLPGAPTFMIFSGTLSKDSLGRDTLSTSLIRPTGTQPLGYDPKQFKTTAPGTAKVTFNSATSATFEYNFEGQSGVLNWVPQIFAVDQTALKYSEKVIATWTGKQPFMVTKTGVTKVVNKTQYQAGGYPLFNCELASVPLPDGKVLTRCTNAVATPSTPALTRVISYIDPTKGEQYDYAGTVPANIVWRSFENNADKPEWGAKARVSDGWYYTLFDSNWILNFQADSGVVTTVKAGTFLGDGNINVMITYSN